MMHPLRDCYKTTFFAARKSNDKGEGIDLALYQIQFKTTELWILAFQKESHVHLLIQMQGSKSKENHLYKSDGHLINTAVVNGVPETANNNHFLGFPYRKFVPLYFFLFVIEQNKNIDMFPTEQYENSSSAVLCTSYGWMISIFFLTWQYKTWTTHNHIEIWIWTHKDASSNLF